MVPRYLPVPNSHLLLFHSPSPAGHEVPMLIASLLLATLAIVVSAAALTIAVVQDLQARDRRIRRLHRPALPAGQPTLRLWEPHLPEDPITIAASERLLLSPGPDITVGPQPTPAASADDQVSPPRAA